MKDWKPPQVADAAGARLLAGADAWGGPERVTIDSREAGPGALFVGLPGEKVDGGAFAAEALAAGAWGVLTAPEHGRGTSCRIPGVWMTAEQPLAALQRLATAWRRALAAANGSQVIGVTGSTGKTSTKDLLRALLKPHRRVLASRANFNTEIGLPLELLAAPADTEVLVLEMGMRGAGQIDELARVAEPDVGVIVSVGPVHVELLGSVEAVAAAKAELIAALEPGATAIVPAGEPLLAPHMRRDLTTVTFGDGENADIRLVSSDDAGNLTIHAHGELLTLTVEFTQAHLRRNLLAAVGAALAVGVHPSGRVELELSPGRGQRIQLPGDVTLIDDCYNANPMSMQAALADLAATAAADGTRRRTVAVLGDMLELGPAERSHHEALGRQARAAGVDVLIAVGPLAEHAARAFGEGGERQAVTTAAEAALLVPGLIRAGDVVLVKASRGIGLEAVCEALTRVESAR